MKIIEPSPGTEACCNFCKTKVLLEKGDVVYRRYYDDGGYVWVCPYCREDNKTKHTFLKQ